MIIRKKRTDYKRTTRHIHVNPIIYFFIRHIFYIILQSVFTLHYQNNHILPRKKAFVILANHSAVFDPFLISCSMLRPVQYIVSDSNFRLRFSSLFLYLVGAIPKTKAISDFETIRNIVKVKNDGGVIGIFPEGQSTWDGSALPMVAATNKLIKSLKLPVYFARVHGAYLTWPRWAKTFRRGAPITIHITRLLTKAETKTRSTEEIHAIINKALTYNAMTFQKTAMLRYTGSRQAEYLERVLFICPECKKIATLYSHSKYLTCQSCKYSVYFNHYGFFEARQFPIHFKTIDAWNKWQQQELQTHIEHHLRNTHPHTIFPADSIVLFKGYKSLPLRKMGSGYASLYSQHILVSLHNQESIFFPIQDIVGLNIQNNEHIEFYMHNTLFRITHTTPRGNSYKWDSAIKYLCKKST